MTQKTKIFCNNCRNHTNHDLVYSQAPEETDYLEAGQLEDVGTTLSKLWVCLGCEQATMQELTLDDAGEEIGSEFYPSREKHHLVRKSFLQLNSKLAQIYEEIIICYNDTAPTLCATGLRALLEGVCADKGITGKSLYHKINNLDALLPGNIVENLHHFRFMGNEAVHELSAPSMDELRSAIEVMQDLLNYLYHLDYKAANLARKTGLDNTGQPIQPSIELIKRVLERSPKLAQGQAILFQVLYQAGDEGLNYDDLAIQIDRTKAQLSGVLGALGRRINNTKGIEGKPGIVYFFEHKIDINGEAGAWGWAVRYELREVIKKGNYDWAEDWK
jgi:hypothetical protein